MRLPSGLNATLHTAPVWPVSGWPTGWPVAASHTRTVLSPLPVTMRLPSGLNATLVTASVWPVSGWPMGWPVAGVPQPHRLVVAAGGDALAVGAERHADHRVGVAGQRLADRAGRCPRPTAAPSCRQLPEAMRLPSGLNATLHTAPVWPVSGAPIGWPVSASHTRTVLSSAAGGDALAVGAERHTAHRVGVAGERLRRWAGRCRRPTPAPSCRRCR